MDRKGRPEPVHRRVEDGLIEFGLQRDAALADGIATHEEFMGLMVTLDGTIDDIGTLCETQAHINACTGGEDGLFSCRAVRSLDEARLRRLWKDVVVAPIRERVG